MSLTDGHPGQLQVHYDLKENDNQINDMNKRQKITRIRLMRHFLAMESDIQMLNVEIESCD